MSFQNLKITVSKKQNIEVLSDDLLEAGALSVTFEDAEDTPVFEPLPDEVILWEKTLVSAIFSNDFDLKAFIQVLQKSYTGFNYQIETIIEKEWEKVWMEDSSPLCFQNRLWVCSSACEPPHQGQPMVRLDPGLAFGTGTHPTTALCLDWLAANPPIGKCLIDYGAGSGILGIAALKLGAKKVYAIDHDPQALQATRNNAAINQISREALEVLSPNEFLPLSDILLANILANPLVELASYFATKIKSNGRVVLSGILDHQLSLIYETYKKYFSSIESKEKEGWLLVTGIVSPDVPISNEE